MQKPNSRDESFSVGIGTTGRCNFNCPHCYSKPVREYSLTFAEISTFLAGKNVDSINYGTGENILNPEFIRVVNHCHHQGIKQSLTSNGYTILELPDEILLKFNDIDISLDFSDQEFQDNFRKGSSWEMAQRSIEKCRRLGIEFSIATALMNINFKGIPFLLKKVKEEACNLRMNIFKRVPQMGITKYELSYEEFWEAMDIIFENGNLISCSEPIINAMLKIPPLVKKSPCGTRSLRIHPNGQIVPCVYWNASDFNIKNVDGSIRPVFESKNFQMIQTLPQFCIDNCDKVDLCGGGCASRRFLRGEIHLPDTYCPIYQNKPLPAINVSYAHEAKDLVHSSYLCTLIFEGR
jgi:radical SAM protein with 4Fe4S-binding SPASM domain